MIKLNADEFIEQVLKGERDFSNKDLSGLQVKYRGPYGSGKYTHPRFEELCSYLGQLKEPINFNGSDLSEALLEHVPFGGGIHAVSANLRRTALQWASLPYSVFIAANLEETQMRGAGLDNSNFSAAKFVNAGLNHTVFERAVFDYAEMGVSLYSSILKGCSFKGANMEHADLTEAEFDESTLFIGARNLDLSKAHDVYVHKCIRKAEEMGTAEAVKELGRIESLIRTNRERESFEKALKKAGVGR